VLRKTVLLCILLPCLGYTFAATKPPDEVCSSNCTAQTTQPDKRGTLDSPLVVDARAVHSDDEAAEEAQRVAEQKRTNRWNIWLTSVIAICAFLQFCGIVAQVVVYLKQTKVMRDTLAAISRQATTMDTQATDARNATAAAAISTQATLDAINRQVDLMKEQSEILKKSVTVAETGANAAPSSVDKMISKERPRLRVIFEKPILTIDKITGWFEIPLSVSIFGTTEAFISGSRIYATTGDETGFPPSKSWTPSLLIPPVITPKTKPIVTSTMLITPGSSLIEYKDEALNAVREGKKSIYCSGFIMYSNVFDETWVLKFSQKHTLVLGQDGSILSSYWANFGKPEDNGEYKTTVEKG
jgi:hypothetical protein